MHLLRNDCPSEDSCHGFNAYSVHHYEHGYESKSNQSSLKGKLVDWTTSILEWSAVDTSEAELVSVQTNREVFIDVLQDGSLNVLLDRRVSATLRQAAELVTGTTTDASPHVPRAAGVSVCCFNCCLSR